MSTNNMPTPWKPLIEKTLYEQVYRTDSQSLFSQVLIVLTGFQGWYAGLKFCPVQCVGDMRKFPNPSKPFHSADLN